MKKKLWQVKAIIFVLAFISFIFFTNDFGIIDIEKTAIITALGIDKAGDEFELTAQIALPQASNTTTENSKAVISAKGATSSEAIHEIGNITGWYPKLAFCNLIILGESMLEENVNASIDYFSRTLKIQDSACLTACEGSAKELLTTATPLDNISAFAIQKILFKNRGMTSDVATNNVKNFSVGYYSRSGSSFMPKIKTIPVESETDADKAGGGSSGGSGGSSGGGGKGGGGSQNIVFDAASTLLFKDGMTVGVLDDHETKVFNLLRETVYENIFIIDDVEEDGKTKDVLLTVIKNKYNLKLEMNKSMPVLKVKSKLFCRLEDCTCTEKESSLESNIFVPDKICKRGEEDFKKYFDSIISKCRESGCDLLKLDEMVYRHHNKYYNALKGRIYENLNVEYDVSISGVK